MKLLIVVIAVVFCAISQCQARGHRSLARSPFLSPSGSSVPKTSSGNGDVKFASSRIILRGSDTSAFLVDQLQQFKHYCDEHGWTNLSEYTSYWIDLMNKHLKNQDPDKDNSGDNSEDTTERIRYKKQRYGARYSG